MPPKVEIAQVYRSFTLQRGRLTNLDAELAEFNPEEHGEQYLRHRDRTLKGIEDSYNKIVEKLLGDPDEAVFDENLKRIQEFDNALGAANVQLQTLLKTFEIPVQQPQPPPKPRSRLPPLPVPTFSGQVTDWVYFKDEFTKLIGLSTELDPVEKLHYLRKALEGDAAAVQSTNDTYDSLWAALTKKYDVKRLILDRHLSELQNLPAMTKECPRQLEALLGKVLKNVRVLESLELEQNDLSRQFIINIVSTRLDPETKKAFGMRLKPTELIDYDEMFEFLQGRCRTLESLEEVKQPSNNRQGSFRSTPKSSYGNQGAPNSKGRTVLHTTEKRKSECALCGKEHFIAQCEKFVQMTPKQRLNQAQLLKLCCNCFNSRHATRDCTNKYSCKICTKRHNTLLHLDQGVRDKSPTPSTSSAGAGGPSGGNNGDAKKVSTLTSLFGSGKEILLGTAVVLVRDVTGQPTYCRALLDSCSQPNIMTEDCAQRLRLKRVPVRAAVLGLEGRPAGYKSRLTARVESRFTKYSVELNFVVMSKITGQHPDFHFDTKGWKIPADKQLADPEFNKPQKVDLILGAEIFFEILSGNLIKLAKNAPTLCETEFGWTVGGKLEPTSKERKTTADFCGCVTVDDALYDQVKRFWEVESCRSSNVLSVQEREVEKHFTDTHFRQADGRYVVSLPTKPSVNDLGDSKRAAVRRFMNVERRLDRNPDLKQQYVSFMDEYQQLGHMKPSDSEETRPAFFLPHHSVLKPDSSTTKLRVVFDGSAKSSTGLSLNDVIKVGATVQQELFEILIRFRKHQVAFTADIGKMYRQVLINEQHQPLQQIMWRKDPSEELTAYSLKTVTYGTASAPFLATRALQQLADDERSNFPIAASIAKSDFYVDDILSGADTIKGALELQHQLIEMLKRGGFELHKWCANNSELLSKVPIERQEKKLQLSDSQTVKALGISWHPSRDMFAITTTPIVMGQQAATKRSVLSDIARLFDPLGIAGPIIVTAKILLQRLWQKQTDWDEPLDAEDERSWEAYRDELKNLQQVDIPRCVLPFAQIESIVLHGFCDASTAAYGACVYVQCRDSTGNTCVTLLCSKSRVAPLKTITVPRLELCSAQLLAQLISKVKTAMDIQFKKTYLWSDSTIVLSWIQSQSSNLKTFVAHRIAEIQDSTNSNDWRHVPTDQNPADIISRGLQPSQLKESYMWWHGPSFLAKPEEQWPTHAIKIDATCLPEMKTCLLVHEVEPFFVLTKFSSFLRLQRVMAYVLRFAANCRKRKEHRNVLHLGAQEMTNSLTTILRTVQSEVFAGEFKDLSKGKPIAKNSPLFNLNVFQDDDHLIRVGGRIRHSQQTFDVKHQIVLPKHHHVTKILIRDLHERNGHVGQQGLLAIVRQSYWPVGAKDVIKGITRGCVLCFKHKPRSIDQAMGDLPSVRTTVCHPFINTGVDYAGPLQIKVTRRTTAKAYVAIFVCMATKAVHIELVSDLTSKAFIAALSRFTSRRGHCRNLYSDNGTNFVGAKRELKQLYEFLSNTRTQEQIATACAITRTEFHFVPPRAPHFGGLWEAAVKSTKHHLYRIVGPLKLSFEELSTVLTKVEAILNSRPLVPESCDPEDVAALTPGHFLIGRPLVSMVEPNYTEVPSNRLDRWQLLQKATQHFWQRWSTEYLTTLQQRAKVFQRTELKLGLLVLIKEDNVPPTQWLLARVSRLVPGEDSIVRVVSLKTKNGSLDRPVVKLCILPNQEKSETE